MGTRPSTFDGRSSTVDRRGAGPMPGPGVGGSTVAPQTKHTSTKQTNNNKQSHTITGPGFNNRGLGGGLLIGFLAPAKGYPLWNWKIDFLYKNR